MLPNPKKGKEIALARQRLLTQQKILHQQSPGTRSGKNTHRKKAERQPGERASPGDRLVPQIYFCQCKKLRVQEVKFLARLKPHSLARSDGDLRTGPRVAPNPRLPRAYVENPKSTQFNPVTRSERLLQTFKN
jgi:hypothetical protein